MMGKSVQMSFGWRVLAIAALFAVEVAAASVLLDGAAPVPRGAWLTFIIHQRGPFAARYIIGFSTLFATFAYLRYRAQLAHAAKLASTAPVRWGLIAAHLIAMSAFAWLSTLVYGGKVDAAASNLAAAGWLLAAGSAIVCAAVAAAPFAVWAAIARGTRWLWLYAAGAAAIAGSAETILRSLWGPTSRMTYSLVQFLGRPLFGDMVIQPAAMRIGTHRFTVVIADECSGLEGIALLLVFAVIWLILFRDEVRFPHALVLLPAGVVTLYFLNAVRILALIAIGSAGAKEIAKGGFHSQAGWLAFNSVAFGLCLVVRRIPWISVRKQEPVAIARDSTAALLVPFLAILAAGMISRAVSGNFEWWYGLRFAAAGAALIVFRGSYRQFDWRPGWLAVAGGVVVFAFWVLPSSVPITMPSALASASAVTRTAWIAGRVLCAVVAAPIAEELAFRGYAMRRLISADFEKVSPRAFTWFSLLGSSLLFGLMHGGRWLPAAGAGVVYGLVMLRRGRIGDAVLAHATTNAVLAGYVLVLGQWQYW